MKKMYRKSEWMRAALEDGALVTLRKPTTPEWVDAVAETPQIDAVVLATIAAVRGTLTQPMDLRIPGKEIEALSRWLARWTLDVVGVEIEGEQLAWSALETGEQEALWAEVSIGDLTNLWACVKLGMRGGDALEAARKVGMLEAGLDVTAVSPAPAPAPMTAPQIQPTKKTKKHKKGSRG